MNCKKLCALTIATLCASPVFGFGPARADPIRQLLFPPELIMEHRSQLELNEHQQAVLKTELQNAQATLFDLRWQLNEESEKLAVILKTIPIDEEQMLIQSDKVMDLEQQVKRVHLTLLTRLKNMLSKQQIQMLREFRPRDRARKSRD